MADWHGGERELEVQVVMRYRTMAIVTILVQTPIFIMCTLYALRFVSFPCLALDGFKRQARPLSADRSSGGSSDGGDRDHRGTLAMSSRVISPPLPSLSSPLFPLTTLPHDDWWEKGRSLIQSFNHSLTQPTSSSLGGKADLSHHRPSGPPPLCIYALASFRARTACGPGPMISAPPVPSSPVGSAQT